MIYKAIKNDKIIAVSDENNFNFMVLDLIQKDESHSLQDYICIGEEFVLNDSPEGIEYKNQKRVLELKELLSAADYWGQKYIDGEYTPEEWEEKKAQRKAWREEIRSLENCVDSDG